MNIGGTGRRQSDGAGQGVVDTWAMLEDLRLAVGYASKAGLLIDPSILKCIAKADRSIRGDEPPDALFLTKSLNRVVTLIAPITLADLEGDGRRDPFSKCNQERSHQIQFFLTAFALMVLVVVVCYARDLKREQGALTVLEKIESMEPREKLTELRKIAQLERPLAFKDGTKSASDQYHHKVSELAKINSVLVFSKDSIDDAARLSLIPLLGAHNAGSPNAGVSPAFPDGGITNAMAQPTTAPPVKNSANTHESKSKSAIPSDSAIYATELCDEKNGELVLPREADNYPAWMKDAMRDALSDFCFQLKVVSVDGGQGTLLSYSLPQLQRANEIRDKSLLRVTWILPFLYGLLGATVFVMRNVASVRSAAMENFAVIMRLGLGGIAGIVVGWVAVPNGFSLTATGIVSLPFVLAFVAGYAIDVLFTLLDRMHRSLVGALQGAPAKSA